MLRSAGEGMYSPGLGWIALPAFSGAPSKRVVIQRNVPGTIITHIQLIYDYTLGSSGPYFVVIRNPADYPNVITQDPLPSSGTNKSLGWSGSLVIAQLEVNLWSSGGSLDGDAKIKKVVLTGVGANPLFNQDYGACEANYVGIDMDEIDEVYAS